MRYGNRHPKWKKVLSSPFTILGLMLLAFVLFRAVNNINEKSERIDQKLSNAQKEYTKLLDRERSLQSRVDFLSTDEGKEAELRLKYRATLDGEKVAVIIEDEQSTTTATTTTENISWWKKIFGLLGL